MEEVLFGRIGAWIVSPHGEECAEGTFEGYASFCLEQGLRSGALVEEHHHRMPGPFKSRQEAADAALAHAHRVVRDGTVHMQFGMRD